MGRHRPIKVGDKFLTTDNVEVTVVTYLDAKNVEVEDSDGNRRAVVARNLLHREIRWRKLDGSLYKSRKLMASKGTGTARQKMLKRCYIGSVWTSKLHGEFSIVDIVDSQNVTVRWKSNGEIQTGANTQAIYNCTLPDRTIQVVTPRLPVGYYVYMATVDGYVVYIGRGKGDRYRHAYNGRSTNKELNRLYFTGAPVIVEVLKEDMEYEAARQLEKELIAKYKPLCNEIIYNV